MRYLFVILLIHILLVFYRTSASAVKTSIKDILQWHNETNNLLQRGINSAHFAGPTTTIYSLAEKLNAVLHILLSYNTNIRILDTHWLKKSIHSPHHYAAFVVHVAKRYWRITFYIWVNILILVQRTLFSNTRWRCLPIQQIKIYGCSLFVLCLIKRVEFESKFCVKNSFVLEIIKRCLRNITFFMYFLYNKKKMFALISMYLFKQGRLRSSLVYSN